MRKPAPLASTAADHRYVNVIGSQSLLALRVRRLVPDRVRYHYKWSARVFQRVVTSPAPPLCSTARVRGSPWQSSAEVCRPRQHPIVHRAEDKRRLLLAGIIGALRHTIDEEVPTMRVAAQ